MSSNYSTSRSTRSQKITDVLIEFDKTRAKVSKRTNDLLCPSINYEYRRIKNAVIYHGKLSKEDMAATLIQKTFRMHLVKRFFSIFLRQYRHIKYTTERPYFIALLLNSHAHTPDRRKLYEQQFRKTLFCNRIFHGYYHPPFEIFTVTGQCLLHPTIDGEVLSQFVKKVYRHRLQQLMTEWRLITKIQQAERNHLEKFETDVLSRKRFGNEYVCFVMWHRYTQLKKKRKIQSSALIPQWQYHIKLLQLKASKKQKANEQRLLTIKKQTVQALLNRVLERREEEIALRESDNFRIKRNMIFALSAWAHYIVIQHSRVNVMRTVFRKWFGGIQLNFHLRVLMKKFEPRHALYSKRRVFSAFVKNRRIQQITNAYLYCKMQTKPSLALFFISMLRHDDDKASFYLAMYGWSCLIRRKKKWHQFVFQNIKACEYDVTKRKALAAFRHQTAPIAQIPISLVSQRFQQETLYLYEYVMKSKIEDDQVFLVSSDEEAKTSVKNAAKNATLLRKIFFKMWRSMEPDPSLMMRVSAINTFHQRTEMKRQKMPQNERTLESFKKALAFLKSYNLASEGKFRALQRTITENNKRCLANRMRCTLRDNMIIYAHYSHVDAETLKVMKPLFTTNDKLKIVAKIKSMTEALTNAFVPMISIVGLGSVLEQKNTFSFNTVNGCRSRVPHFMVDFNELRSGFLSQMKRVELSATNQIQFDRLMAVYVNESGFKNLKTYQRLEPYQSPLIENKPSIYTGVNRRLLETFPLKGRESKLIGHSTNKFSINFNVLNQSGEEEEDLIDLGSFDRNAMKNSILTMEKSKGSMFFNTMNSFASFISASSSMFSSSKLSLSNFGDAINEDDEFFGANSNVISESSEDEYTDSDEFDDGMREKRPKKKKKNGNDNGRRNDVSYHDLTDTFDDEMMKSISLAAPLSSPRVSKKFKLFMEILFGRNSRDQISVPMANLRRKLIQELNYKKHGTTIPGVLTQNDTMPISNLIQSYHEEGGHYSDDDSDNEKNQVRINTGRSNRLRTTQSQLSQEDPSNPQFSYNISYKSKKYRPLLKSKHTKHRIKDPNNPDQEIEVYSSSSSDDLEDIYRERPNPEDIPDIPFKDAEEEEEVHDDQFDAASEENAGKSPSKGRKPNVTTTPFIALDEDVDGSNPMSKVDKLVFKYIQDNLKNVEDEGILVDVDEDEDDIISTPDPDNKSKTRKKLWKAPKLKHIVKPRIPKNQKLSRFDSIDPKKPIVIEHQTEVTPSMGEVILEDSKINTLLYNDGKSTLKNKKKHTAGSYSKNNHHKSISSTMMSDSFLNKEGYSGRPIIIPGGRRGNARIPPLNQIKKLNSTPEIKSGNFALEDQVVSFGGGKRGITEEALNLQRVRLTRQKQLLKLHEPRGPVFVEAAPRKKAKELEDIKSDYSNLKSIVSQLIQMMASAQDDSNEFEKLRRRVRMLRKKPTFVGLMTKPQPSKEQFYARLQSTYVRYTRRKNTRAAADELLLLMRENTEFAPMILNSIERTAKEEERYVNSRLQRSRLGKQQADPTLTIHYIDVDWLNCVPDYSAVAVQYMKGHSNPKDLEAVVAPTGLEQRQIDKRKRGRPRKYEFSSSSFNWDKTLEKFELADLILISSLVPEELMDKVITDHRKFSKGNDNNSSSSSLQSTLSNEYEPQKISSRAKH